MSRDKTSPSSKNKVNLLPLKFRNPPIDLSNKPFLIEFN